MAYCDIGDVQAQNPTRGDYSATTKPTSTQVEEFIDQISNTIDSTLAGRGLTVPVTTPAYFVDRIKLLNAQGAAALAEMAMFPETGGPGFSPHGKQLWDIYQAGIKQLREGQLPEALGGSKAGPRSMQTEESGTETTPEENYPWLRPKLPKDKEF